MQYIPLEYNNNNNTNIKHSGMVLMMLRSNGVLLSHFKRNRDAIPPHPTPPQALHIDHWTEANVGINSLILLKDGKPALLHPPSSQTGGGG
jgi:hypothetical protein